MAIKMLFAFIGVPGRAAAMLPETPAIDTISFDPCFGYPFLISILALPVCNSDFGTSPDE